MWILHSLRIFEYYCFVVSENTKQLPDNFNKIIFHILRMQNKLEKSKNIIYSCASKIIKKYNLKQVANF